MAASLISSRTIWRISSPAAGTRMPTSSSGMRMPKVRRLAAKVATAQVCALAQHGRHRGCLLRRLGDRALDPRQLDDVGDARQQLAAGADDLLRRLAVGRAADRAIHSRASICISPYAEDGGQRRAQIVPGLGQEARLVGVRLVGIHARALGARSSRACASLRTASCDWAWRSRRMTATTRQIDVGRHQHQHDPVQQREGGDRARGCGGDRQRR